MKYLFFVAFFLCSSHIVGAQNQNVAATVPTEIRAYLNKHFPNQTVVKYKKEVKKKKIEYKVYLDNFAKLEFNNRFEPVEIEGGKLPDSVIPERILAYMKSNYSHMSIVQWEMKRNKQEVELNDGTELEFDLEGQFLRIDD